MKTQIFPSHDPRIWPRAGDVITWHFGVEPNGYTISTRVTSYDKNTQQVECLIQLPTDQVHKSMDLLDWRASWDGFPIESLVNGDQPDIIWKPMC